LVFLSIFCLLLPNALYLSNEFGDNDVPPLDGKKTNKREELFAALDEVTENHMTLKDRLDEARAFNRARVMEREEAEAECKEVS